MLNFIYSFYNMLGSYLILNSSNKELNNESQISAEVSINLQIMSVEEVIQWIETYTEVSYRQSLSIRCAHDNVLLASIRLKLDDLALKLINEQPQLINQKNKDGETPLMLAATLSKNVLLTKTLIGNGANVHEKGTDGRTLLHDQHNLEIIDLLMSNGINPNIKDNVGNTPVFLAALYQKEEVVRKLISYPLVDITIKNGANNLLVIDVVQMGLLSLELHKKLQFNLRVKGYWDKMDDNMRRLCKDFFINEHLNDINTKNEPILHVLIKHKCHKIIEDLCYLYPLILIAKDENGCTPLHIAMLTDNAIYNLILDKAHECDLNLFNIADNEGNTPLHWAALKGDNELCYKLLENGSSVMLANKDNKIAAQIALDNNYPGCAELLVNYMRSKKLIETKGADGNIDDLCNAVKTMTFNYNPNEPSIYYKDLSHSKSLTNQKTLK